MKDKPIIEFNDFTFQYFSQSEPTLKNINLKIYPGQKVLIVGPSGSGKSTIGNCINGLIPFYYKGKTKGSLKVKNQETKDLDIFKLSKTIGTVLQDADAQFVGLTVGEDIAFAMENDCVLQDIMKERVARVAKMVDMDKWLSSSPYELSGGQKQRTTLAGVMINDVDVLLFDEPLANLDPATGKQAIDIIDGLHEKSAKTIVIIEHRLEDVLYRKVDRIIAVNDGQIVADLDAHEMVASDVLIKNGIREPLYVTALKYAGINVTKDNKCGYIDTIVLGNDEKDMVKNWYKSIVKPDEEEDKQALLSIENIDFSYEKGKKIIKDLSLDIKRGEMISIVGKNGAGKSTLAKLLCGFEKLDSGYILWEGYDLAEKSIKERGEVIGYVMQNPNQMICKTMIYDEVAFGLKLKGLDEGLIAEKVKKALDISGLSPFRKWPISALSYGQKKRVTIASILASEPDVIILDEPTAGQDYKHYNDIMEFLLEINKMGTTVIMITHDMHLMLEYTKRAIVITDGRILTDSCASKILTDSKLAETANLKETSLFQLAKICDIDDATDFVQGFIDYEREVIR